MTAVNQNFELYSGNSRTLEIEITGQDGSILNITDITAKWAMKRNPYLTENDVLKTTSNGILITDPVNGKLQIKLLPEDTEEMFGEFHHELEITDVPGNVSTVMVGTVTLIKSAI
jgi:hypothetical protein